MNIKQTCFGRHWQHMLIKSAQVHLENGTDFKVSAPKDGFIIKNTAHEFYRNIASYMVIQQLNSCDACVVSKNVIHSQGSFIETMYLVSYDTVVCEARFLSENRNDDTLPYVELIFGEHWNYSYTTVQHVYKFLRMFDIKDLRISDYAKQDKKLGCGTYTYASYVRHNGMGRAYRIRFSSDKAILDFKLNDASRIVWREIG